MDSEHARLTRELLEGTQWVERTRSFARTLRSAPHTTGGLLMVGTPVYEPWHLTAHLDDEARLAGVPELSPTLVRHEVPKGAPAHLAYDLRRLEEAGRGETVLVVAQGRAGEQVLERVNDARRCGAVVLAMENGDRELRSLAHEAITIADAPQALWPRSALRPDGLVVPGEQAFETAQHLVSLAAGETSSLVGSRRGFRDRLARWLDTVSGPVEIA
ncbi:hypothetical protein [Actinomadura hibisca]|uniref:hypothetical protein n=1 Tax=Actinomadura hibisca TaxID=68565 RepID=UPI00083153EE|nr:hypothetical protein [Actinomadura hibisca]